jgi:hypothetical protein
VVFGSFITAKAEPNDIDILLLMEDTFDLEPIRITHLWYPKAYDHHKSRETAAVPGGGK